jgi:hypothetical protein
MPWIQQYGKHDIRVAVTTYVSFIWKEAHGLSPHTLYEHSIWSEISDNKDGLTKLHLHKSQTRQGMTVVTPFVLNTFKHSYFAHVLYDMPIKIDDVEFQRIQKLKSLGFNPEKHLSLPQPDPVHAKVRPNNLVGKIIGVEPDTASAWTDDATIWYAYV